MKRLARDFRTLFEIFTYVYLDNMKRLARDFRTLLYELIDGIKRHVYLDRLRKTSPPLNSYLNFLLTINPYVTL